MASLLTRIPIIDDVLRDHAAALGDDVSGYRNHAVTTSLRPTVLTEFSIALRSPHAGHALRQTLASIGQEPRFSGS